MAGEKIEALQSLNQSETEVLRFLLDDPNFRVRELANKLYRGEGGIRTNLTAIFDKLGVPDDVVNKREWVVREYSEYRKYVFQREEWEAEQASQRAASEPEIFIKPPDPIPVDNSEAQPPSEPAQRAHTFDISNIVIIGLLVLLIFALATVVFLFILNNNLYQANVTWQTAASQTASAPLPGPILFSDDFNNGQISPQWAIINNQPMVTDGLVYPASNGNLVMSVDSNQWGNYTVYARIVINGCSAENGASTIHVRRVDPANSVLAYQWYACDWGVGTVLNVVITAVDNELTVAVNQEQPISGQIASSSADALGGILMDVYSGSAIDYVLVVGLP